MASVGGEPPPYSGRHPRRLTARLRKLFPDLSPNEWAVTSSAAWWYNCMAWSVGDTARWWDHQFGNQWPENTPRSPNLDAYVAAFEAMGYIAGSDASLEDGVEKIALYADANGLWTHVTKQLPDGSWSSKLGKLEDIRHDELEALSSQYGDVAEILARPTA